MKKIIALLLCLAMAMALCACGSTTEVGENTEATVGTEAPIETQPVETEPVMASATEHMTIHGICVDNSYVDDDGSPLKMVYLFYTLTAGDTNLEIDSTYTNMTIGANTYQSANYANSAAVCSYTSSFYYGSYIEDVYVGTSLQVIATFKIPEGDLTGGKTITLEDYQIPDEELILMTTDEIQFFESPEEMAAAMDPAGYEQEMYAREPADAETEKQVKDLINGYYWSFYVNSTSYEIEFWADNNFEVRTAFGTNGGTYTVQNGYIFCTYSGTGYTIEIPWVFANNDVDLDVVEAFDVY